MFARSAPTEETEDPTFIPLHYDPETDTWVSLLPEDKSCERELDAARVCLEHVLPRWAVVVHMSRTLRALCEHPGFEFHGDGIDSDMVRRHARVLSKSVHMMSDDLENLLHEQMQSPVIDVTEGRDDETGGEQN